LQAAIATMVRHVELEGRPLRARAWEGVFAVEQRPPRVLEDDGGSLRSGPAVTVTMSGVMVNEISE